MGDFSSFEKNDSSFPGFDLGGLAFLGYFVLTTQRIPCKGCLSVSMFLLFRCLLCLVDRDCGCGFRCSLRCGNFCQWWNRGRHDSSRTV